MEIIRQDTEASGRYVVALGDGSEAQVTFFMETPEIMVVDHTFVPPPYRHLGVAATLTERLIADARAAGIKIKPRCPYTETQFRRRGQEWADVLAG